MSSDPALYCLSWESEKEPKHGLEIYCMFILPNTTTNNSETTSLTTVEIKNTVVVNYEMKQPVKCNL
jgi:hypothetical protein